MQTHLLSLLFALWVVSAFPSGVSGQELLIQGQLKTVAGGPATDGKYGVEIAFYTSKDSETALYTDFNSGVVVENGVFTFRVGNKTPLDNGIFIEGDALYVGVSVQGEPELARVALHKVPYAVQALSANGLKCSGCVTTSHLSPEVLDTFSKSIDLHPVAQSGKYSALSELPDLSVFATKKSLHPIATSGKHSDLEDAPDLTVFATKKSLHPIATSGKYSELEDAPDLTAFATKKSLHPIAITGKHSDLEDAPDLTVFATKKSLAPVASSGTYSDLKNVPDLTVFAPLSDLALVASTGLYSDLKGAPDPNDLAQVDKDNVFSGNNTFKGSVSVGTLPSGTCTLNTSGLCIDGQPGLLVRFANDQQSMDALAQEGQIVYRKDEKKVYVHTGKSFRAFLFAATCGDGIVDFPEECDDGQANADKADLCRTNCKKPKCGDKIQDTGEQCDDGPLNADEPDKCRLKCKKPTCGDNIIDAGEVCDGTALGGKTCATEKPGASGTLACKKDCTGLDTTACLVSITKIQMIALNAPQNGNMSGIAAVDAQCQSQAEAVGLGDMIWKAFLSDSKQNVKDLITGSKADTLKVVNQKGGTMFNDWNSIFDGTSIFPNQVPMHTFNGTQVTNSFCSDADGWTGTFTDGKAKEHCNNWTSSGASGTATEWDGFDVLRQESHSCSDVLAVTCVSVGP